MSDVNSETQSKGIDQHKETPTLESPILSQETTIQNTPAFSAGRDKLFRKITDSEGKIKVVAEYRGDVSSDYLTASVVQQNVLHNLFPHIFVLSISESTIGIDGKARFVTDFIDNIDQSHSIITSGPGIDYERSANNIAQIKLTPAFNDLIRDLTAAGFCSANSQDQSEINEIAGNVLLNNVGEQIIVDVMGPIRIEIVDGKVVTLPKLNVDKARLFAQEKGALQQVASDLDKYKETAAKACIEEQVRLDKLQSA